MVAIWVEYVERRRMGEKHLLKTEKGKEKMKEPTPSLAQFPIPWKPGGAIFLGR